MRAPSVSSSPSRRYPLWRRFETLQVLFAALLLAAVVVVCASDWREFREAQKECADTQLTISRTTAFLSLMKDAETGQRGYLLTGDPTYLTSYTAAMREITNRLALIDQSVPPETAKALREHTRGKLREMEQTVEMRRRGDAAGALRVVQTNEGHQEMSAIRKLIDRLVADRRARLSVLQGNAAHLANQTLIAAITGSATLFAFLCWSSVSIGSIAAKRIQAIEELQQSRAETEQARQVLEATLLSIGDAVIATDLEGCVVFLNAAAERLTGWTSSEARCKPLPEVFRIVHETTRVPVESPADKVKRLGNVVGLANHTVLIARNGREIPIEDSGAPIVGPAGVTGVVLVFRDVTERRESERALEQSEIRYRELANSMPQMVWTADPGGAVTYRNERWRDLLGLTADELSNTDWSKVLRGSDLTAFESAWAEAAANRTMFQIECQLRKSADHRPNWFLGRAIPVLDSSGEIVQWIGTFTDIHERKQTETALEQANENLNQFAFSASHDLQEPLRNLVMFTQLFAKRNKGRYDEESDKLIQTVIEAGHRLETLIHDLLAYVQTASGPGHFTERTDANAAVAGVLENLAAAIRDSRATVTKENLPTATMDSVHLQQLFQNLISNALKYRGADPPRIRISAARGSGEWIFSVQDNGIGIAPEYAKQIFGIFKRLHRASEYAGTGIGLAICQRILDRYGGRIWVESQLGHGSNFRFAIPETPRPN